MARAKSSARITWLGKERSKRWVDRAQEAVAEIRFLPRLPGFSLQSGSPTMPHHSKRSIEQYYAEYPEHDRLRSARGQLEFERTKRIVQRFLPTPPAIVADVGGGTGPYS
jgi:hypothetical protein